MKTHNSDMFPEPATLSLYSALAPLLRNSIVDDPFLFHESESTAAKRRYHFFGRLGMILVVGSTLFTVADALLFSPSGLQNGLIDSLMILLGIVGIGLQIWLLQTKQKQRWLVNRYAAERLRSIKFQAYPLARRARDTEELSRIVQKFYAAQIMRLQMELNARDAVLAMFSPASSVILRDVFAKSSNDVLCALASDAYKDLRINYQKRFAADESKILQGRRRLGYASADLLYVTGVLLVFAALIIRIFFLSSVDLSRWIDFFAIAAFVLGLAKSLIDNASLSETSEVRYEQYVKSLETSETRSALLGASFGEIVRDIECVVLEELSQFCLEADRISYRL